MYTSHAFSANTGRDSVPLSLWSVVCENVLRYVHHITPRHITSHHITSHRHLWTRRCAVFGEISASNGRQTALAARKRLDSIRKLLSMAITHDAWPH